LIFGVDMEMESRIFSVTEYIRPSDGEPIRSVVLETKDSAVVVWHTHPGQEITAHVHPHGQAMSRWNVILRLDHAVQIAAKSCPDLAARQITPHVIRHTTAMHLLQAGVDISVIALWLGHESPTTTHQYVEADLAMKERALARLQEPETKLRRYRAPDSLINFLRTL
jgi:integrase